MNDCSTEIRRQIASIERQAQEGRALQAAARDAARARALARGRRARRARGSRRGRRAALSSGARRGHRARDAARRARARVSRRGASSWPSRERILTLGSEALLRAARRHQGAREPDRVRARASASRWLDGRTRRSELAELREQRAAHERERSRLDAELDGDRGALATRGAEALARAEAADAGGARRAAESRARARGGERARSSSVLTAIARAEDRLADVEDRRAELERAPAQRRRGARGRPGPRRRGPTASSATSRRGCATCSPSAIA